MRLYVRIGICVWALVCNRHLGWVVHIGVGIVVCRLACMCEHINQCAYLIYIFIFRERERERKRKRERERQREKREREREIVCVYLCVCIVFAHECTMFTCV